MFIGRKTVMRVCRDGVLRPAKSLRTRAEVITDFWSRVDRISSVSGCWIWMGGKVDSRNPMYGYGVMWANGKKHKTHRFAYEISNPSRPALGKLVCHTCDNPPCCNPAHLFLGTHMDNMMDCIAKGRMHKEQGEERYNATLTEKDIREIRRRYQFRKVGIDQLATRFNVCRSMIYAIVKRKRWKHVA